MTPILADYDLGDGLLTVLALFFLVIWVWILITILIDLFRDHELSGWWKAVWLLFLLFVPVIAVLIYLIARGGGMRERALAEQAEAQKATDQYIRSVASSPVDELHKLADLRDRGAITPEEYERMKAKVVV
ncbi:MAG TPA: SHOCT domain-containing protein [Conexibacter sp.]|jgi:ABC-type multidrug transport system fused ATPase/permease subunit|nr:SHOCT domain-containing protein [Conexibacter sp.]